MARVMAFVLVLVAAALLQTVRTETTAQDTHSNNVQPQSVLNLNYCLLQLNSKLDTITSKMETLDSKVETLDSKIEALTSRVETNQIPEWFRYGTSICFKWLADGDISQCNGGSQSGEVCANTGQSTAPYHDNTNGRGGGCRMQWGIISPNSPSWFSDHVQLCYTWYADGNAGQCGGGAPTEMCAQVGSFTEKYRDDTDGRSGGCNMAWKLSIPHNSPEWLQSAKLCYTWRGGSQCGGSGTPNELCAYANRYTNYYRDDTDSRSGGCDMSWSLRL